MARLRQHPEARELVERVAPHEIDDRLIEAELLARRGRRIVCPDDDDELAAAGMEGAQIRIRRVEDRGQFQTAAVPAPTFLVVERIRRQISHQETCHAEHAKMAVHGCFV